MSTHGSQRMRASSIVKITRLIGTATALALALACAGLFRATDDPTSSAAGVHLPTTPAPTAAEPLTVRAPGLHEETLTGEDGSVSRFTISVPRNYAEGAPSPLIVVLHYGVGSETTPPFYGRAILEALVEPALGRLHAVFVSPDAAGGDWTTAANETAILRIMERVIARYDIDTSKILLTGYSMGAIGTWVLINRHPERFSAAIPMAGRPVGAAGCPVPIYVIHSQDDELLPLQAVREQVEGLRAEGCRIEMSVVTGVSHYQVAGFAEALRKTVPWIEQVWKQGTGKP